MKTEKLIGIFITRLQAENAAHIECQKQRDKLANEVVELREKSNPATIPPGKCLVDMEEYVLLHNACRKTLQLNDWLQRCGDAVLDIIKSSFPDLLEEIKGATSASFEAKYPNASKLESFQDPK